MTSAWLTQRNVDPALLCSEPVGTSLPTRQLTRNTAALGQCICRATALWTLFYGSNGPTICLLPTALAHNAISIPHNPRIRGT